MEPLGRLHLITDTRPGRDALGTVTAALAIAGDDMGAPTFLRMLERWTTANALAAASRNDLMAFARAGRHGWPDAMLKVPNSEPAGHPRDR